MADIYDVIVTVKRANPPVSTTGHIDTRTQPAVLTGIALRKHNYSSKAYERLEGERTQGTRSRKLQLFLTYEKPFPDIREDDIIEVTAGQGTGEKYKVLNARPYEYSFQCDTEEIA